MQRKDLFLGLVILSAAPITPSSWLTRIEENYNDLTYRVDKVLTQSPNSAYLFLLLIPIMFYLVEKRTVVGYTLSISIVSLIIFTCTSPKKKEFPFAALMASGGITSDTPSIGDNGDSSGNAQTTSNGQPNNTGQTTGSTPPNNTNNRPNNSGQNGGNTQLGGSGGSSAGTPVTGFYFLHRDYLDSVTMITNGQGEMVSGMDISTGKSVVDYKPYGEIDRKNSDGPDIFRYKYTGQEEDRETGLYYYKARYYDPEIGRFIEPDSYLDPNTAFGMNQYAYVEGNPIMYNDPTGHSKLSAALKRNGLGKLNFKIRINISRQNVFVKFFSQFEHKKRKWYEASKETRKRNLANYPFIKYLWDRSQPQGGGQSSGGSSTTPAIPITPVTPTPQRGKLIGTAVISGDSCNNFQIGIDLETNEEVFSCTGYETLSWSRNIYLTTQSGGLPKEPFTESEPLKVCLEGEGCTPESGGYLTSGYVRNFPPASASTEFYISYNKYSNTFFCSPGQQGGGVSCNRR